MPSYRICQTALPVTSDLTDLACHWADQPWCQLLDSAAPGHPDHRWQILVHKPLATLTASHGRYQLTERNGREVTGTGDPTAQLQTLLDQLGPQPSHPSLPFVGGLVGYWGYDLARQFEQLPNLAQDDLPLPELAMALYDQALLLDLSSHQLYAVAATHHDAEALLSLALATLHQPAPALPPFALTGPWVSNMDRDDYLERFTQVQHHLHEGDCYQVNLAQRFSAPYQGSDWLAYQRLRRVNGAPFGAFIRLAEGSILCLSPERFLGIANGKITTRPIKGTRPKVDSLSEETAVVAELAASVKERAENVMIVDLLRNDLGKVATPGSVQVPELFRVEHYPYVYHLVSTVTANLAPGQTPLTALRACFPGGSITGAPKLRAMSVIEALEPHRRSVYCGSIGYISSCGTMDSNIAIRTLVGCDGKLHVWGGGGLVVDSNGEAEYRETLDKLARILPILEQP